MYKIFVYLRIDSIYFFDVSDYQKSQETSFVSFDIDRFNSGFYNRICI